MEGVHRAAAPMCDKNFGGSRMRNYRCINMYQRLVIGSVIASRPSCIRSERNRSINQSHKVTCNDLVPAI